MLLAKFDALSMIDTLVPIMTAHLLALPLGWERKTKGTVHVGWRTLPLVSVGTCAYLLISRKLYEHGIFDADGPARTLRAMMTGIGFIGGGAILKGKKAARGHHGNEHLDHRRDRSFGRIWLLHHCCRADSDESVCPRCHPAAGASRPGHLTTLQAGIVPL